MAFVIIHKKKPWSIRKLTAIYSLTSSSTSSHDKAGLPMGGCRHSPCWTPAELCPSEKANEAEATIWPLVPSTRINYSIERRGIFLIHWYLQSSNILNCFLHLIFHFRRRNGPRTGVATLHFTNFAFDLSVVSQGEKPDFSSSMPLYHPNPSLSTAPSTLGKTQWSDNRFSPGCLVTPSECPFGFDWLDQKVWFTFPAVESPRLLD